MADAERSVNTRTNEVAEGEERTLLSPDAVGRALPPSRSATATVLGARESLRALLRGTDTHRLAVIVGPCSVHDPEGALEYAQRLAPVARAHTQELVVLMRVFVEKPRTNVGWKGLVNDPTLDGSCDIGLGLATARRLMLRIGEIGLGCATEILEPFTTPYLRDLVAWGGVGARTSESPVHRQLASDACYPIGFKNGTDGDVSGAIHAMLASQSPQTFPAVGPDGRSVVRVSRGNPDVHLVLRGGRSGPNYDAISIASAVKRASGLRVARPVMVDCSHGNSERDPSRQPEVCHGVLDALEGGTPGILGVMIESYLEAGRQDADGEGPLRHGVSITDACLGWDDTEKLLHEVAARVKKTR